MWPVDRPTFDAKETFLLCISKVRNVNLRQRLTNVQDDVESASVEYDEKGDAALLNEITPENSVGGTVSIDEMVAVYDRRMASKAGPGREVYDQLKMLPKGDRCPFCDQRNVSTLDHILPKALYPALVVTPANLVGACMECNKLKRDLVPASPEEVVLHPYFDNIAKEQWLTASVIQQNPCAITFQILAPGSWSATTAARAQYQFELLGLPRLYSNEAAREIANIRHNLHTHFDAGGAAAVAAELTRQWQSRRDNRLNSWQTAMYEAAAGSQWFCDGGFS